jgi:DNA-binding NtrC family response regulator
MSENARILVVDDEKIVCDMSRVFLIGDGYEVTTFTDSAEARAALETETFDVIITDLKMKEVDGIELLEYAKERNPDTKVIVLTAFGTLETAVEAFHKDAFDFFTKPVRIHDLQASVRRALGREPEE